MPSKALARRQEAARQEERIPTLLFPEQRRFVQDLSSSVAAVTGIGGAKTKSAAIKVAHAIQAYPGMRALVTAPTFDQLREGPLRALLDTIDPRLVIDHNRNDHVVFLAGDREIHYRSTDIPNNLRGPEYGIGWMDECDFSVREAKLIFIGRIRQPGMPCQKIYTTTPKGMNWAYEDFYERLDAKGRPVPREERDCCPPGRCPAPGEPGHSKMRLFSDGVTVHTWPSKANPHISSDLIAEWEREYGETDFALQELYGEFVRWKGLVYNVPKAAMVSYFPRPPFKRVFGGVDFGSTSAFAHATAAGVIAEDFAGRFWVLEEFYARPVKPGQLESYIAEASLRWNVSYWEGDRSQFHAISMMQQAGVPIFATPHHTDVSVLDGITIVQRRFSDGMRIVEPRCQHLAAELRTYQWDEPKAGQVARPTPRKINDDSVDWLRYGVVALERAAAAPPMFDEVGLDWGAGEPATEMDAILRGKLWTPDHDDEALYFAEDGSTFALPRAG